MSLGESGEYISCASDTSVYVMGELYTVDVRICISAYWHHVISLYNLTQIHCAEFHDETLA